MKLVLAAALVALAVGATTTGNSGKRIPTATCNDSIHVIGRPPPPARTLVLPLHGSHSEAESSSKVPPRCTVPARLHSSARHGIGPASAQSTLNTPGPCR